MIKRENGELLIQKLQKLSASLLNDIELESPCSYIRFGAVVQVVAPYMPKNKDYPNLELCVSAVIDGNLIRKSQEITDKCYLSLASNGKPCARNSFVITRYLNFQQVERRQSFDIIFILVQIHKIEPMRY